MGQENRIFVGLDVAKAHHAVAVAEGSREGEVRFLGEIAVDPTAVRRMVTRLEKHGAPLHFCYEAGPTGYGLYRQIVAMDHECSVIAPSLIPRRPGDRIKTNRRDALQLARLLRAAELTPIGVPEEPHEAIRELIRSREAAVEDLRRKRQAISSFMLRNGRSYPGKTTWGARHSQWLQAQRFDHPAHRLALQEMALAAQHAAERLKRTEAAIVEFLPTWSLAPIVEALQALRGVRLVTAATIMVEIGDLRRFESPRQLMGYLGLVPGERSTGEKVHRTGITKAGNTRLRRMLVESAWTYRHLPNTGKLKHYVHERVACSERYRLEGAGATLFQIPGTGRSWQEPENRSHRDCSRACWVRVGYRNGSAIRLGPPRTRPLRMGGGEATVEELPSNPLWPATPTPVVRQGTPRTKTRSCGNQPAHQ